MKTLFLILFSTLIATAQKPSPLLPSQVVVVYNTLVPASKELAEFYALNRRIPEKNLIGIEVTEKGTIDRATYEKSIRNPLVAEFNKRNFWTLGKTPNGIEGPVETQIRCVALMKGLPLRISRLKDLKEAGNDKQQFKQVNEASVDSELSLMGIKGYPKGGFLPNPYFKKNTSASQITGQNFLLVGRLEASSFDQCKRMVLDALDVEKEGLWGRAYIDHSLKPGAFAIGDQWMSNIAKMTAGNAHPTIIDRQSNTFVTNYPMTDAALYFGWYTTHRNGPFLDPKMRFKKGAIAVHIHSFSAQQLMNPAKNWSAGLIDRGAAATLGNTWEPFLQLTHHLDIFYQRLAQGYSLVEAAYMSINVLSWQNVVLGDPLYTPYRTTEVTPENLSGDRNYKIIRYAGKRFTEAAERTTQLVKAAEKTKNGSVYEMLAYGYLEAGDSEKARKGFLRAKELFPEPADKLRQDLNLVEIERRNQNTTAALKILREAKAAYAGISTSKAIDGLLVILDPPAPPATKSKK
jgi:uncharacterized protein (TIGR03790 family)